MKLIRANGNGSLESSPRWPEALNPRMDRRNFLRAAGLGGLGMGLAASMGPPLVREVEAAKGNGAPKYEQIKTICGNCAVACGFIGEVQNGVWVAQEPWFEHPINLGSLCSKGAAAREHVISEKRLRYPMKLEEVGEGPRLSDDLHVFYDRDGSSFILMVSDSRSFQYWTYRSDTRVWRQFD